MGNEKIQHLGGHIPIRDIDVGQFGLMGQAGNIVRILEKYGRFGIGIGDAPALGCIGSVNDLFWGGWGTRYVGAELG